MPKPQKIAVVEELKAKLASSDAALLTEFRGLKVEEMKELRRLLSANGTEFKVVKNTLTRIAVREGNLEEMVPLLEGSTAIAFVQGDPVAAAKSLDEISKKYPALIIKGGLLAGKVLDAARAQALAKVKPREVLLSQLAGMLQSPMQKLAGLLAAPLRDLGYALGAYRDKLEKESPPPAPAEPEAQTVPDSSEAKTDDPEGGD
jgi:large subunit ribosomal protein L10